MRAAVAVLAAVLATPAAADETWTAPLVARLCDVAHGTTATFFATPYAKGAGQPLYVVWREAKRIYVVADEDVPDFGAAIADPPGPNAIDLSTGVVATPEDVGTSTFLVDRGFVAGIVYDAVIAGRAFTLDAAACAGR